MLLRKSTFGNHEYSMTRFHFKKNFFLSLRLQEACWEDTHEQLTVGNGARRSLYFIHTSSCLSFYGEQML